MYPIRIEEKDALKYIDNMEQNHQINPFTFALSLHGGTYGEIFETFAYQNREQLKVDYRAALAQGNNTLATDINRKIQECN